MADTTTRAIALMTEVEPDGDRWKESVKVEGEGELDWFHWGAL